MWVAQKRNLGNTATHIHQYLCSIAVQRVHLKKWTFELGNRCSPFFLYLKNQRSQWLDRCSRDDLVSWVTRLATRKTPWCSRNFIWTKFCIWGWRINIYIYIMYILSMYTNHSVHILNYILCVYIRTYIYTIYYVNIYMLLIDLAEVDVVCSDNTIILIYYNIL